MKFLTCPSTLMSNLSEAISSDDIKAVRKIFEKYRRRFSSNNYSRYVQLSLLDCKSEEVMKFIVDFIDFGADDLGKRLIIAIVKGNLQEIKELLKKGAKLVPDRKHEFPSGYIFCRSNLNVRKKILELLIKHGYDVSFRNRLSSNIFFDFTYYFVEKNDPDAAEIAEILHNSGVPLDEVETFSGLTPLLNSIKNQNFQLTSYLIKKGADLTAVSKFHGLTPLLLAVAVKNIDIVELLLSSGADVNSQNFYGYTALHEACFMHNQRLIGLLLQHGADLCAEARNGITPTCKLNPEKKNYERCMIIMVKEIAKLNFNNTPVSENEAEFIIVNLMAREHFERCTDELRQMSNTKFHGAHSYYSILNMSINMRKLANLTKNEVLLKKFEKNSQIFPYYINDLRRILNEAIQIRDESILVEAILGSIFGDILPYLVTRKLAEYLTLKDLPLE